MSSEDIAVRAQGLSKRYTVYERPHHRLLQMLFRGRRNFYKEFCALEDISFEVSRGETIGIIGRNGAGKSTLLQMLCGTLSPSDGKFFVQGRVAALLELGAGFNPEFSGRENVVLNATILGLTAEEIEQRFDAIADFADIGQYIDQPVKTYSSGMYVRLAFAVIAHVDADVLVIDEALSVGDALFTQKCMRFLRRFREHGTLLFVSHDSASVTALCQRAIWLEHGRLRAIGNARDICKQYNAEVYQLGRRASEAEVSFGQSSAPESRPVQAIETTPGPVIDPRWDCLRGSPLQNAMTVQAFQAGDVFGTGHMHIEDCWLELEDGRQVVNITGGELVELVILYSSALDIDSVIAGFQFKDRLGQILFGDNTCISTLDQPVGIRSGERQEARFRFQMPLLPAGEYSVTVSVAEGTQLEHIQHHWVHDALLVHSLCASVSTGIVGVPMFDIRIQSAGQLGEVQA